MNAPIPLGTYVDTESPGYPYNLDKAKALMAASSVPNGFTLPMIVANNNQDRINTAIILKDEWAKIGVNVDIQQLDTAACARGLSRRGQLHVDPERLDERHERSDRDRQLRDARRRRTRARLRTGRATTTPI